MEIAKINPETLEVANTYLSTFDISETAKTLGLSIERVTNIMDSRAVKTYIDTMFRETGYRNRHKLGALLDKIVDSKLEEAELSGQYSNKDLLDILKFVHEVSQSSDGPKNQTNIQVNNNYTKLMESLLND